MLKAEFSVPLILYSLSKMLNSPFINPCAHSFSEHFIDRLYLEDQVLYFFSLGWRNLMAVRNCWQNDAVVLWQKQNTCDIQFIQQLLFSLGCFPILKPVCSHNADPHVAPDSSCKLGLFTNKKADSYKMKERILHKKSNFVTRFANHFGAY